MMHIGLLGFGVVGGGVWALCAPRDDLNVKRVLLRQSQRGPAGGGGHLQRR